MVETHERFSRIDWGECVDHEESRREIGDKKGSGLKLLKMRDCSDFERVESKCRDILVVRWVLGDMSVFIVLVYIDVKDKERNRYIHSKLDQSLLAIGGDSAVVVMVNFNGHVKFLGEQGRNYSGELLLEFMETWSLVMLNYDI